MPETVLDLENVAQQLKVSTRTVRRIMLGPDGLKGFHVGSRLRFTQSEVDAYIKRQQHEPVVQKVAALPDWTR